MECLYWGVNLRGFSYLDY